MNEFTLSSQIERLNSVFAYIMNSYPDENNANPKFGILEDADDILNSIFTDINCKQVIFTKNLDKFFFGVRINPAIHKEDVLKIITTSEPIEFKNYKVELDSKLFEIGLSSEEITAYVLYEISSMLESNTVIDKLRGIIDMYLTSADDVISIRDSLHYSQLIIYAIKDTLTKLSSMVYKESPEDLLDDNNFIKTAEIEDLLISAHQSVISSENGSGDSVRTPNFAILRWMFIMYRSMDINSNIVRDNLKDAKLLTGSKLDIAEIDKTLDAIDHIDVSIIAREGCDLVSFIEACNITITNESLFGGLKKRGLRSLEDDLYTISMQIKNLETENEAIYTMRSINTRLNILEDYLYENQEINENERKHWQAVANKYRLLREELVRKKIWNRKNYGLFYDYNQLEDPVEEKCC